MRERICKISKRHGQRMNLRNATLRRQLPFKFGLCARYSAKNVIRNHSREIKGIMLKYDARGGWKWVLQKFINYKYFNNLNVRILCNFYQVD